MHKNKKVAIAASALLATGALGVAIPAIAHDRGGAADGTNAIGEMPVQNNHSHVALAATITGIPAELTDFRQIHHGAYFSVVVLDDGATEPPAEVPADARRVSIRPTRDEAGNRVETAVVDGSLIGDLGLRAPLDEGVTRVALYPSDGSAAVIVTIAVDSDGNATATSSEPLTVSYSAEVAANAPQGERGHGMRHGDKQRGERGHGMREMHGEQNES